MLFSVAMAILSWQVSEGPCVLPEVDLTADAICYVNPPEMAVLLKRFPGFRHNRPTDILLLPSNGQYCDYHIVISDYG